MTIPATATTLTARLTVDNHYEYYISTDDATLGTRVGESPFGWWNVATFKTTLVPGVPQYLHIIARDEGPPTMFIGDFTLSNSNFEFANGTQLLFTNAGNWGVSLSGFGGGYSSPEDLGPNGTVPWGVLDVSPAARYIWAQSPNFYDQHYFSAAILAVGLDGDYNRNGTVNAADYVTWRKVLGTAYTETDYDVWRANFGEVLNSGLAAGSSSQVPEPTAVTLLSGGLAFISQRRTVAKLRDSRWRHRDVQFDGRHTSERHWRRSICGLRRSRRAQHHGRWDRFE
jgi:hypothetical protein